MAGHGAAVTSPPGLSSARTGAGGPAGARWAADQRRRARWQGARRSSCRSHGDVQAGPFVAGACGQGGITLARAGAGDPGGQEGGLTWVGFLAGTLALGAGGSGLSGLVPGAPPGPARPYPVRRGGQGSNGGTDSWRPPLERLLRFVPSLVPRQGTARLPAAWVASGRQRAAQDHLCPTCTSVVPPHSRLYGLCQSRTRFFLSAQRTGGPAGFKLLSHLIEFTSPGLTRSKGGRLEKKSCHS